MRRNWQRQKAPKGARKVRERECVCETTELSAQRCFQPLQVCRARCTPPRARRGHRGQRCGPRGWKAVDEWVQDRSEDDVACGAWQGGAGARGRRDRAVTAPYARAAMARWELQGAVPRRGCQQTALAHSHQNEGIG